LMFLEPDQIELLRHIVDRLKAECEYSYLTHVIPVEVMPTRC
jgi:hypothetical protein